MVTIKKAPGGAQFEISIDGKPCSYRDRKGAARHATGRHLDLWPLGPYLWAMPRKNLASARKAAKLRSWRVTILRQRAKEIGIVQAPNAKAAGAAAIAEFRLDEEQRKRLVVQERD